MNFDQSSQGLIRIGNKRLDYYNGLLIRADYQLHAQLAEEIQKVLPKGSRILDMGCGQGALSMRLNDLGYNLMACDQNVDDFKAVGKIPFHPINFNSPAEIEKFISENQEQFDGVLGIEVIEHVENPWEYIRSLKRLVKPGGFIFVSTPNVSSWYSRMVYLFTGLFPSFVDPDLMGHINPITPWELDMIARKSGLEVIRLRAGGDLPLIWISSSPAKTLLSFLFLPFSLVAKGLIKGWCTIGVFKK